MTFSNVKITTILRRLQFASTLLSDGMYKSVNIIPITI